jgi:hypothetical protein
MQDLHRYLFTQGCLLDAAFEIEQDNEGSLMPPVDSPILMAPRVILDTSRALQTAKISAASTDSV